jgi:hypothetical protein
MGKRAERTRMNIFGITNMYADLNLRCNNWGDMPFITVNDDNTATFEHKSGEKYTVALANMALYILDKLQARFDELECQIWLMDMAGLYNCTETQILKTQFEDVKSQMAEIKAMDI